MASKLENFRQYNISDYLINQKIFIDYLSFCKGNNLKAEKKNILENLVRTILNCKQNNGSNQSINELTNLCALSIIYSDFEVEFFFDYQFFNQDLQKSILNEAVKIAKDTENDELSYIKNKLYFWLLKMQNQNFVSITELKDTILLESEVKESIEILSKYVEEKLLSSEFVNKNNIDDKDDILLMKIMYELSLYYYFRENYELTNKYLKILIKNYNSFKDANNNFYFKY